VQEAYDLTNDFGLVAKTVKHHGLRGLGSVELEIGVPLKVMLALKVDTLEEGFETAGKPAQFEYKYDGFRMQIHKKGKRIWIYTRRLEDVTKQFPDVVETVKKHVSADNFIIDSEAVGYSPKTKRYMPFQNISQRIKRKYDIDKAVKELPVELNVFDVICLNGKSLIQKPFKERRKLVKKIIKPAKRKIVVSKSLVTSNPKEANAFFKESIKEGNEGLMIKNLNAPYKPGARVATC
jgi:DNA ligase-1